MRINLYMYIYIYIQIYHRYGHTGFYITILYLGFAGLSVRSQKYKNIRKPQFTLSFFAFYRSKKSWTFDNSQSCCNEHIES